MNIQIQVKARVKDFLGVKKKIEGFAKSIEEQDKIDYYFKGNFKFDRTELRLRKKGDKREIKLKLNYFKGGVEENKEYSFIVENPVDLVEMFDNMGITVAAMKHKKSYFYKFNGIEIQMVSIQELGYFIEIEKKCTEKDKRKVESEISELRDRLGITTDMIEKRNYFELLTRKKGSNSKNETKNTKKNN